jgi:hypothetical protein
VDNLFSTGLSQSEEILLLDRASSTVKAAKINQRYGWRNKTVEVFVMS